MEKMDWKDSLSKLRGKIGNYKFPLLVAVAGLILLLWPQGEGGTMQEIKTEQADGAENFSVEQLEAKLEQSLSRISGVGQVTVVLTVETGVDNVYATDRAMSSDDREESLVILSRKESGESAVLKKQYAPAFRGALVICEGGGNPQIKLQITEAISALTGLGADRISVCQGK